MTTCSVLDMIFLANAGKKLLVANPTSIAYINGFVFFKTILLEKKKKKKLGAIHTAKNHYCNGKITGPSCSKLTMSLVNDSLKFTLSVMQIF